MSEPTSERRDPPRASMLATNDRLAESGRVSGQMKKNTIPVNVAYPVSSPIDCKLQRRKPRVLYFYPLLDVDADLEDDDIYLMELGRRKVGTSAFLSLTSERLVPMAAQ